MPSVSGTVGVKDDRKLLKGSDLVAAGLSTASAVILNVRRAPQAFGSPFFVDFDTDVVPGINCWPINKTEARKLAIRISDETDKWVGWGLILVTANHQNPRGKPGDVSIGIEVAEAYDPATVKKSRKSTPKYKKVEDATKQERREAPPF